MGRLPVVNIFSAKKFQDFPQSFLLSLLAWVGESEWYYPIDFVQLIKF